jgi:ketosteroid isomerase-like protein
MRPAVAIALSLSVAGCCCQSQTSPTSSADAERLVSEAVMGMYQAFQQKNLEKVGQYMTADSTCYDAARSVMLTGRPAVLDHFRAILAQHKPGEAWESSLEGMKVTVSGDMAYATYQVRTSQGGMHAVAAVTHVFRHEGDRWLAIHLHRSWNITPK